MSPSTLRVPAISILAASLMLSACATRPAAPDGQALAAAGQATLQVVGTSIAAQRTQVATQLYPTVTSTATQTTLPVTGTSFPSQTPTSTPTYSPTATPLVEGRVIGAVALRAGPGRVYRVVARLQGGETGRPLGITQTGDWYKVAIADGPEGWLPSDSFELIGDVAALAVITDLPPTPPIAASTSVPTNPPPTETPAASGYTCDVTVQNGTDSRHVIFIGQGWPAGIDIDLIIDTDSSSGLYTIHHYVRAGDAGDQIPNGFWRIYQGGHATYTFSSAECSTTVTGP